MARGPGRRSLRRRHRRTPPLRQPLRAEGLGPSLGPPSGLGARQHDRRLGRPPGPGRRHSNRPPHQRHPVAPVSDRRRRHPQQRRLRHPAPQFPRLCRWRPLVDHRQHPHRARSRRCPRSPRLVPLPGRQSNRPPQHAGKFRLAGPLLHSRKRPVPELPLRARPALRRRPPGGLRPGREPGLSLARRKNR